MPPRRPPTREEIDIWFTAILSGTRSRDEANRWASQWHGGPAASAVTDEVVWWALDLLHGVDLPAGSGSQLLHNDDQLREWLAEFRRRCEYIPAGRSSAQP